MNVHIHMHTHIHSNNTHTQHMLTYIPVCLGSHTHVYMYLLPSPTHNHTYICTFIYLNLYTATQEVHSVTVVRNRTVLHRSPLLTTLRTITDKVYLLCITTRISRWFTQTLLSFLQFIFYE